MEEYKDLIDLALKLNDKEWFNHLTEQAKNYEKIKPIDNVQNKSVEKQNIALQEFNNDAIAVQTNEGLRVPSNYEDLEKYSFVKIKSKRNGALKILKGEEVNIEQLSTEESYYYKVYYYGFFQGFCSCYNTVIEKDLLIENKNVAISKYEKINNLSNNIIREKDKQIELLRTKVEILKNITNIYNKLNLWDKIKVVFKNNGVKGI